MEIVFLSCDNTEPEYAEFSATMPWKALPFKDPKIKALETKFKIDGVPRLVVISKEGKLLIQNARPDVQSKGVAAFEDWKKKV